MSPSALMAVGLNKTVTLNFATKPVLKETVLLTLTCTLDAVYTLFAVRVGWATETDPMLALPLQHSDAAFLLVKGASFLVPITALEAIRTSRPKFVPQTMRFGLHA